MSFADFINSFNLKIVFTFLFLLSLHLISFAQDPYAIQLNRENGLPSNVIYSVFQDSQGFIWLTSDEGLTRYDGFEYKTYKSNDQTSLAGSVISEDKFGRIWYENFDGYIYYVEANELRMLNQNVPSGFLHYGLSDKYIFVCQQNGVDVFDLATLKLVKTVDIDLMYAESSKGKDNDFYILFNEGLVKIDTALNVTTTKYAFHTEETAKQLYGGSDFLYVVSKRNEKKTAYFFDTDLRFTHQLSIANPDFIQGSAFVDNQFWIHTPQGTFIVDTSGVVQNNGMACFAKSSISCVIKDRQNNYWISTTNDGIFLVPDFDTKLYTYNEFIPNRIEKSNGGFIVSSKRGELLELNYALQKKRIISSDPEKSEIYFLYCDTLKQQLFYSSKGFRAISNYDSSNTVFTDVAVKDICLIDDKYYAVAASGFGGLMLRSKDSLDNNSLWDEAFHKNVKTDSSVFALLKEKVRGKSVVYDPVLNLVYLAASTGLYKISPTIVKEIKWNGESFYASKLVLYNGQLVALSSKGNLYQINRYEKFEALNQKFKLNDFEIRLLKSYGSSIFFLSNQAIHRFDFKTRNHSIVETFVSTAEINDYVLHENWLLVLTNSGILTLNVDRNEAEKSTGIFHLNYMEMNGMKLDYLTPKEFSYTENSLNINFSLLDFGNTRHASVFYRLNPDALWQEVSPETRTLRFAALSPDEYSIAFKVNNQVQKQTITFTIHPPFWKQIWFLGLCCVLILLMGYAYYRWQISLLFRQIKLLREKIQLEKSLSQSILTSIKSQMNPHFFYNALNTIQAYIFTNDKKNASAYLSKFSKLTRMILEMSGKEKITLNEEINALTLYLELEQVRFSDDFDFVIHIDKSLDQEMIKLPSMLIQPYVENAIKHGLLHKKGEKKVELSFVYERGVLKVIIDDNGIGRKRSAELNKIKDEVHESFSSTANQKRLEILNRDSTSKISVAYFDKVDDYQNSFGTTVVAYIPIND